MGKVEVKELIQYINDSTIPKSYWNNISSRKSNWVDITKEIIRILKESEEVRECRFCEFGVENINISIQEENVWICTNKKSDVHKFYLTSTFGCNFWEKKNE